MSEVSKLDRFLARDPYLFMEIEGYKLWEHPTYGDTAPIYMSTPGGRLINTGFYDLGDFLDPTEGLALCIELDSERA
jgi:hypothetical protein